MPLIGSRKTRRTAEARRRRSARLEREGGAALRAYREQVNAKKRRQRAAQAARLGIARPGADRVLDERAQWGIDTYVPKEHRVLMRP